MTKDKKRKAIPPSLTRGKYVIRRNDQYYGRSGFRRLNIAPPRELMIFDSNAEAKEFAVVEFDMKTVVVEKLSEIASTHYEFSPKGDVTMTIVEKYENDSFADSKSRYLKDIDARTKAAQKELTAVSKEFFKKRDALLAEIQKCNQHHDTFIKALKAKQWVL